MSVEIDEYDSDRPWVEWRDGTDVFLLVIEKNGAASYRWRHGTEFRSMQPETVAELAGMLSRATKKPDMEIVPAESECVEPVAIGQLRQLRRVTHHHDLISWEVCERLLHGGFVETSMGDYSCLTKAGVELCWALGLLDEKENADAEC